MRRPDRRRPVAMAEFRALGVFLCGIAFAIFVIIVVPTVDWSWRTAGLAIGCIVAVTLVLASLVGDGDDR